MLSKAQKTVIFHNLNYPISTDRLSDPQKVMLLMTTRANTKTNGGKKLSLTLLNVGCVQIKTTHMPQWHIWDCS